VRTGHQPDTSAELDTISTHYTDRLDYTARCAPLMLTEQSGWPVRRWNRCWNKRRSHDESSYHIEHIFL